MKGSANWVGKCIKACGPWDPTYSSVPPTITLLFTVSDPILPKTHYFKEELLGVNISNLLVSEFPKHEADGSPVRLQEFSVATP